MSKPLIPITLVTGFLGSGKTTLLKEMGRRYADRRLVYLVNEFSPHDVDGAIVSSHHANVVSIPGGSIFCKCLVTEFINHLRSIPSRFGIPDGVVIEASGMADPRVMRTMLLETRLDTLYKLVCIVSVVDPGSFFKLRQTLPTIVEQVKASDIALIGKSDVYDTKQVEQTRKDLRSINPTIRLGVTCRGITDVDLLAYEGTTDVSSEGMLAKCRDPRYETVIVEPFSGIDLQTLQGKMRPVEPLVYRLKGYLNVDEPCQYVDFSASGWNVETVQAFHQPMVVVITQGSPGDDVNTFLRWLKNGK